MTRWFVPALFLFASVAALAAEDSEQLDAEFLEYLANLEGDEDDWTLVAEAAEATPPKDADVRASKSKHAEPAPDKR